MVVNKPRVTVLRTIISSSILICVTLKIGASKKVNKNVNLTVKKIKYSGFENVDY